MDANTREAVIDAMVKFFYDKSTGCMCPPDEEEAPGAVRKEVGYYFEDIEKRLSRLEHPMDRDW